MASCWNPQAWLGTTKFARWVQLLPQLLSCSTMHSVTLQYHMRKKTTCTSEVTNLFFFCSFVCMTQPYSLQPCVIHTMQAQTSSYRLLPLGTYNPLSTGGLVCSVRWVPGTFTPPPPPPHVNCPPRGAITCL
jgi:hypothetical protein